ncbi:uncharacterized protein LOC134171175 [Pezoporus occidentalis]|uniref:uncharacterized protein LOC134171175 n=1 Tax=Pezoporus occidentalis TaxID=407982 RepID=UPI002F909179
MEMKSCAWKNRAASCLSIQCSILEKVLDKNNLFIPPQGVPLKACILGDLCAESLLIYLLGGEKALCYCSSFTEYFQSLWPCSWKVVFIIAPRQGQPVVINACKALCDFLPGWKRRPCQFKLSSVAIKAAAKQEHKEYFMRQEGDTKCSYYQGMKEEKLSDCHALFLKTVILHFSIKQQLLFKMRSNKIHLKLNTEVFVWYFHPQAFSSIFLFLVTLSYFSLAWYLSTALLN